VFFHVKANITAELKISIPELRSKKTFNVHLAPNVSGHQEFQYRFSIMSVSIFSLLGKHVTLGKSLCCHDPCTNSNSKFIYPGKMNFTYM
jgi:hypothetical protein